MRKGRKRRLAVFLGAAAVMVLLCTLSGCGRHATRGELIDWFQKNYTDAKLVVSREKTEEDNGWTIGYTAYLKDRPELVFQLQSRRVIVGGLREHHNFTDFDKVYGACTMSNEQDQYFVYYYDSSHTLLTEDHIDDVDYMVSFILEEDGLLACAIGSAEPALEPSSSL